MEKLKTITVFCKIDRKKLSEDNLRKLLDMRNNEQPLRIVHDFEYVVRKNLWKYTAK